MTLSPIEQLREPVMSSEPLPGEKSRILIVDDHPVMRKGLSQVIDDQTDMEVCGEASNIPEAMEKIQHLRPDLVIVDISLGDGNGIELIKQIRSRGEEPRMLVSSMHDESLFAERAIRAGAQGYVNKHEDTDRLIQALRDIRAGRIALSEKMTDRLLNRVAGRHDDGGSPLDRLTDRELEVFRLIGEALTTREIAARLELSRKTVETYRENIKAKLNLANAAELTRHAVQWVLEEGGLTENKEG
ncbi:MAG: response regulator transcription factor [Planctomycetaceae bacterium]|nr:response regulator transcription factor [Planctomycetaceae bacterium]